jgi:aspartyl-tRNA(Asn)/glutamyl-tRNA(Gln) amidotransferase subunit C
VSVTVDDVRHIAGLARLGLDPERIPSLVAELNRILQHMDVLSAVPSRPEQRVTGVSAGGMPLRVDVGPQIPLARTRDEFAPAMRDGFFIVPRLSTHEDAAESGA